MMFTLVFTYETDDGNYSERYVMVADHMSA
jgi:hypothetical protein